MRPIWLKDAAEMQCLAREMSNWTLNWNYWTGASQQGCWGQWAWCSSAPLPDPMLDEGLSWAAGQPDNFNNSDGCLQIRVLKNATGLVLLDRPCNSRYVMACQGVKVEKPCEKATCPPEAECKKNVNFDQNSDCLIWRFHLSCLSFP
jgi:hypothetical protein